MHVTARATLRWKKPEATESQTGGPAILLCLKWTDFPNIRFSAHTRRVLCEPVTMDCPSPRGGLDPARNALGQCSMSSGPRPDSAPFLTLSVKFYWDTATPFRLQVVCGCFAAATAEA